jgi:hypothetical protein
VKYPASVKVCGKVTCPLKLSTSLKPGANPYTPVVDGRKPVITLVRVGLHNGD